MGRQRVVWKAAFFMFAVMLVWTARSQAQTQINITGGSFLEVAGSFGSGDTFSFQFAAPGDWLFLGSSQDPVSGFQSCTQFGCSLSDVLQIAKSGPLQIAAPGALTGVGGSPSYCWSGGGFFSYSSGLTYHIANGVLTVQENVVPNSTFWFTPGDPNTCDPNGLPTFVVTGQWRSVAQFNRQNNTWYLSTLEIHPLP